MSEMNYNWSYQGFALQNNICLCCKEPSQVTSGIIRDDDNAELAFFVGNMTPSSNPR